MSYLQPTLGEVWILQRCVSQLFDAVKQLQQAVLLLQAQVKRLLEEHEEKESAK